MTRRPLSRVRNPTIASARLILQLPRSRDARDLEAMFHDPRVYRYLPYARRIEPGHEVVSRAHQGVRSGTAYRFIVRTKECGAFVGSALLFGVDHHNKSAELGYALARDQWGCGYATEAGSALLRWGFKSLRLRRVSAIVAVENLASQLVLRKLGFRREGRRREAGRRGNRWGDDLEFGLLRPEFRES
ncbi:MAG: GNAT family N-acetyltransferase [Thermoplasmata archaeon]